MKEHGRSAAYSRVLFCIRPVFISGVQIAQFYDELNVIVFFASDELAKRTGEILIGFYFNQIQLLSEHLGSPIFVRSHGSDYPGR